MVFRTLGISLLLASTIAYAQGRKPAVEEFVGIEVEEQNIIPQGTEALYNFEQDLNNINAHKTKPAPKQTVTVYSEEKSWNPSTLFAISLIAGLPLMLWFMVMSHLKKKASVESASNIEVLENYRKERERKKEQNIKKAS